jgi:hypothetical protein
MHVVTASATELVLEVDRAAKCDYAAWIVRLKASSAESPAIEVNAYRNMKDYQAKEHQTYCPYSKRIVE